MTSITKLDEKLEGADNFQAWKYKVMLILEEIDLEGFIEEDVADPKGERLRQSTRRIWLMKKGSLQILSRIT